MKTYKPLILFVALLALIAIACQAASSGSGTGGGGSTPAPTVLFKDDFSKTDSGWSTANDADGINDYQDGGFRFLVNKVNWYFWSNPGRSFSDVTIEVDGKKLAGPDENDYGVICRYSDTDNFYFFTIGSDGYYGVSKYVAGKDSLVGMTQLEQNTNVIKGGDATNHIKVTCKGSSLTLEVNGTILADVLDTDLTSGDIGLIAGSYDTVGVDVSFDNLIVTKP